MLALLVIIAWAVSGTVFGFSGTWRLVINTATSIVTFLMVFVIEHAQNQDSIASHLKLDELIASSGRASHRLVAIEDLDEREVEALRAFHCRLAELARAGRGLHESHSLDEAEASHSRERGAGSRHARE